MNNTKYSSLMAIFHSIMTYNEIENNYEMTFHLLAYFLSEPVGACFWNISMRKGDSYGLKCIPEKYVLKLYLPVSQNLTIVTKVIKLR